MSGHLFEDRKIKSRSKSDASLSRMSGTEQFRIPISNQRKQNWTIVFRHSSIQETQDARVSPMFDH